MKHFSIQYDSWNPIPSGTEGLKEVSKPVGREDLTRPNTVFGKLCIQYKDYTTIYTLRYTTYYHYTSELRANPK